MVISPASAYWNQREKISKNKERIKDLAHAVDYLNDLNICQWSQLVAFTLEFKPDLILELGRGKGNSTCVFTEVSNWFGGKDKCRVVSLCISDSFEKETIPKLKDNGVVSEEWFNPLECINTDILDYDYEKLFSNYERVLVFWDAHGYSIAECVLGKILPLLQNKKHHIIMHDLSDNRYMPKQILSYDNNYLWRGNNDVGQRVVLGNINSAVEQSVSIVDFVSRNNIDLVSSDHSFHQEIGKDIEKVEEMKKELGNEMFSLNGHWFCFTLNNEEGPFTFPRIHIYDEMAYENEIIDKIFNTDIDIMLVNSLINNKEKKIAIFGAGRLAKAVYRLIEELNRRYEIKIEIKLVVDNDLNKISKDFYGIRIEKPTTNSLKNVEKVIIASGQVNEICNQLNELGIKSEDILMAYNSQK
ncbi:hypothetical protein [Clostridium sp. OS1-26]|uniref:nucleoside-diphosphate sugar epimerase/dehydratase n=1 Tax=Clostridium sp. OS1-26 TaxID=3070681 RepID=UPI0027E11EFA|nr:hypothetical protein [Clostridium sp. OS1-26]WML35472.1 hypothetical protein RCG18_01570 [Clostridium sp. OS1-26]